MNHSKGLLMQCGILSSRRTTLFPSCNLVIGKKYFESIRSPKRRLAWLASRHLLKLVLGTDAFVELLFDTQGKPYLGNYDVKISLSHTDNYAAVIVSKDFEVGIDIEDPSRDISILRNKFLSQEENNQLIHSDLKLELMLY